MFWILLTARDSWTCRRRRSTLRFLTRRRICARFARCIAYSKRITRRANAAIRPGFGCIEDARGFCGGFFDWYNQEHHHSGIALLTPEMVHYGLADEVSQARLETLQQAYRQHPRRFVRKAPEPPRLPEAVWINPPAIVGKTLELLNN